MKVKVIVRCRNVLGGIYKSTGTVVAIKKDRVAVRHRVSEVEPTFVVRQYSRATGSWVTSGGSSRCCWITEGQLKTLSAR